MPTANLPKITMILVAVPSVLPATGSGCGSNGVNLMRTAILREREAMASRILVGYCRKLLSNPDRSYVDIDEVVAQMTHILHIYAVNVPTAKMLVASATAAHEATGAVCGEDGEGV